MKNSILVDYQLALRHRDSDIPEVKRIARERIKEVEKDAVYEECGCMVDPTNGRYFKICDRHFDEVMGKLRE